MVIHESTWRSEVPNAEKQELSERYGTTPLEFHEWTAMLERAGVIGVHSEFDQWSQPEMFWKIRKDRDVIHHDKVFTPFERLRTMARAIPKHGFKGVLKAYENADRFFKAILAGKLGYCLFWGRRADV